MSLAVARSAAQSNWLRYQRSWGLWLFLVMGPVAARYMVADDSGRGVQIRIGEVMPVVTSPMLGVWLGIVVATLLLPVAWIYLRAATNRKQPAAVVDVTPASRIALALGRFAADAAVLLLALATLGLAGLILGAFIVSGPLQPWPILSNLFLIAAPALVVVAGLRQLFASLPFLRAGLGDFAFFCVWIFSLTMPMLAAAQPSSFAANMFDMPGFVRPLVGPSPSGEQDFQIGYSGGKVTRGAIDPARGMTAPGYAAARAAWLAIGVLLALLAGLLYRPGAAPKRRTGLLARLRSAPPPRAANPDAPPAGPAAAPFARLVLTEARLLLAGRLLPLLALGAALLGALGDYRHLGSPAALLLLLLALTAHAGRSEARGLLPLTGTMALGPWPRRAALLIATVLLAAAMALPATLLQLSPVPLAIGLGTGLAVGLVGVGLAAFSGSATAPRILLLIAWYVWLSS